MKDSGGTFWAATATGVDQLVGDRFSEIVRRPDPVILGEDRGNLYIRFGDGLSCLAGGKVEVTFPAFVNANAMVVASNELWLADHDGIVRTTAESMKRWEQNQATPVDYAIFGPEWYLSGKRCSAYGFTDAASHSTGLCLHGPTEIPLKAPAYPAARDEIFSKEPAHSCHRMPSQRSARDLCSYPIKEIESAIFPTWCVLPTVMA